MKGMETAGMLFLRLFQDKEQWIVNTVKDVERKTRSNRQVN
jgi:hypothetical protein